MVFWCNRHCRTSPVVLEEFWGQVWPKICRKPQKSAFRIADKPISEFMGFGAQDQAGAPRRGGGYNPRTRGRAGARSTRTAAPRHGHDMALQVPAALSLAVHWQFGILIFGPVFGRFSSKLGPKTLLERQGSSCGAGRTKNQPGRPIVRPFRGTEKFRPDCLQVPS